MLEPSILQICRSKAGLRHRGHSRPPTQTSRETSRCWGALTLQDCPRTQPEVKQLAGITEPLRFKPRSSVPDPDSAPRSPAPPPHGQQHGAGSCSGGLENASGACYTEQHRPRSQSIHDLAPSQAVPPPQAVHLDSLLTVYEPQFPDLKNGNNKGCCKDQMSLAQCLARDDGSAGGGYSS